ncbi:MAG: helix-turn-helix transcriptional regulator, partial [Flavobacteriaceae bacterium]|nr:helix-turn-helix transcriptional regulator [Flavobacteriaceae bacterium]
MSKLLYYREKLNLTQEELSNTSGISVRTIQRIEAGTIPKGHTLKVLAAALQIKENQLLKKNEPLNDLDYTACKLINLSSLLFVFIPPLNILFPL